MNTSAIYSIYNINALSQDEVKQYIGSAISLRKRKNEHFSDLRLNKHPNQKLQNAFNKYGESSFKFAILTKCDAEELISKEQLYLDMLDPYYNICKIAGSRFGAILSNKTKMKISESRSLSLIGEKYFHMTVLEKVKNTKGNSRWVCRCDCGNTKEVRGSHLKAGNHKSCGCLRKGPIKQMKKLK